MSDLFPTSLLSHRTNIPGTTLVTSSKSVPVLPLEYVSPSNVHQIWNNACMSNTYHCSNSNQTSSEPVPVRVSTYHCSKLMHPQSECLYVLVRIIAQNRLKPSFKPVPVRSSTFHCSQLLENHTWANACTGLYVSLLEITWNCTWATVGSKHKPERVPVCYIHITALNNLKNAIWAIACSKQTKRVPVCHIRLTLESIPTPGLATVNKLIN